MTSTMEKPKADAVTGEVIDDRPRMQALTVIAPNALLPTEGELNIIKALANAAAKAQGGGLIPAHIKNPEQAAVIMIYGWELGLRPMTALQHVYMVNGKANLSAQAMMGIVRAKIPNCDFEIVRSDGTDCTMIFRRPGHSPLKMSYTLADAQRSGQAQKDGPWKQYTADMLRWNCTKRLCRLGAPDIINAIDGVQVGEQLAMAGAFTEQEEPTLENLREIPAAAYNEGDFAGNTETVIEAEVLPPTVETSAGPVHVDVSAETDDFALKAPPTIEINRSEPLEERGKEVLKLMGSGIFNEEEMRTGAAQIAKVNAVLESAGLAGAKSMMTLTPQQIYDARKAHEARK